MSYVLYGFYDEPDSYDEQEEQLGDWLDWIFGRSTPAPKPQPAPQEVSLVKTPRTGGTYGWLPIGTVVSFQAVFYPPEGKRMSSELLNAAVKDNSYARLGVTRKDNPDGTRGTRSALKPSCH
jgi:hypothetical protein